jgi:DNA polymerase-3 subunit gamma/tau
MPPEPRRDGGASPSAAREMASPAAIEEPASFAALVDMAAQQKEALLHAHLLSSVRLVRFEPGHMEIRLEDRAPRDLPQRLSRFLSTQTGRTWLVTVSQAEGQPSLHQQQKAAEAALFEQAWAHPLVQAALQAFPGAVVEAVHPVVAAEADDGGEAMVGDGEDE